MEDQSGVSSSPNVNPVLKPPKPRFPLKDLWSTAPDEDNTAVRKRRVSFANVNKIKEFSAGAESILVCHTPAYEEPFSMSSDSSCPSGFEGNTPNKSNETNKDYDEEAAEQKENILINSRRSLTIMRTHDTLSDGMELTGCIGHFESTRNSTRLSMGMDFTGVVGQMTNHCITGMDLTRSRSYQAQFNLQQFKPDTSEANEILNDSSGLEFTDVIGNPRLSTAYPNNDTNFSKNLMYSQNNTRYSVTGMDLTGTSSARRSVGRMSTRYSVSNMDLTEAIDNDCRSSVASMDLTRTSPSRKSVGRMSTRYSVNNMDLTEAIDNDYSSFEITDVVSDPRIMTRYSGNEIELTEAIQNDFTKSVDVSDNVKVHAESDVGMEFTKPIHNIHQSNIDKSVVPNSMVFAEVVGAETEKKSFGNISNIDLSSQLPKREIENSSNHMINVQAKEVDNVIGVDQEKKMNMFNFELTDYSIRGQSPNNITDLEMADEKGNMVAEHQDENAPEHNLNQLSFKPNDSKLFSENSFVEGKENLLDEDLYLPEIINDLNPNNLKHGSTITISDNDARATEDTGSHKHILDEKKLFGEESENKVLNVEESSPKNKLNESFEPMDISSTEHIIENNAPKSRKSLHPNDVNRLDVGENSLMEEHIDQSLPDKETIFKQSRFIAGNDIFLSTKENEPISNVIQNNVSKDNFVNREEFVESMDISLTVPVVKDDKELLVETYNVPLLGDKNDLTKVATNNSLINVSGDFITNEKSLPDDCNPSEKVFSEECVPLEKSVSGKCVSIEKSVSENTPSEKNEIIVVENDSVRQSIFESPKIDLNEDVKLGNVQSEFRVGLINSTVTISTDFHETLPITPKSDSNLNLSEDLKNVSINESLCSRNVTISRGRDERNTLTFHSPYDVTSNEQTSVLEAMPLYRRLALCKTSEAIVSSSKIEKGGKRSFEMALESEDDTEGSPVKQICLPEAAREETLEVEDDTERSTIKQIYSSEAVCEVALEAEDDTEGSPVKQICHSVKAHKVALEVEDDTEGSTIKQICHSEEAHEVALEAEDDTEGSLVQQICLSESAHEEAENDTEGSRICLSEAAHEEVIEAENETEGSPVKQICLSGAACEMAPEAEDDTEGSPVKQICLSGAACETAPEAEDDTEGSPVKQICLSAAVDLIDDDLLHNISAPSFLMHSMTAPNTVMPICTNTVDNSIKMENHQTLKHQEVQERQSQKSFDFLLSDSLSLENSLPINQSNLKSDSILTLPPNKSIVDEFNIGQPPSRYTIGGNVGGKVNCDYLSTEAEIQKQFSKPMARRTMFTHQSYAKPTNMRWGKTDSPMDILRKCEKIKCLGEDFVCEFIPNWVEMRFSVKNDSITNPSYELICSEVDKRLVGEYILQQVKFAKTQITDLVSELESENCSFNVQMFKNLSLICKYFHGQMKGSLLSLRVVNCRRHFWVMVDVNLKYPKFLSPMDITISEQKIGELKLNEVRQMFGNIDKGVNQIYHFAEALLKMRA